MLARASLACENFMHHEHADVSLKSGQPLGSLLV